jgi:Sec-independent protein translocase protein TatA
MEILGIGPLELVFILLIAVIVLGPGDVVKTRRTIGRFLIKSFPPQNGT